MPDLSDYPPGVLAPPKPTDSLRTWIEPREFDPAYEVLIPCQICKRKAGTGPLAGIRLWRVRTIQTRAWAKPGSPRVSWRQAAIVCADRAECHAYLQERTRKRREAHKRRHPDLPNALAPVGHCKWCGEPIRFDESREGWKRRRERAYHRGDEWELGDTNCLHLVGIWQDPKRAARDLAVRQDGRCTICGEELEGRYAEVDHVLPVADGGLNYLDNLQLICNDPCHKAKTAAEAKARAKAKKHPIRA